MSSSNIFNVLQEDWSNCNLNKRKRKRKNKSIISQNYKVEREEIKISPEKIIGEEQYKFIPDSFIKHTDFPSLANKNNSIIYDISKKWKDIPTNVKTPTLPSISLPINNFPPFHSDNFSTDYRNVRRLSNSTLQISIDQAFANKSSLKIKNKK